MAKESPPENSYKQSLFFRNNGFFNHDAFLVEWYSIPMDSNLPIFAYNLTKDKPCEIKSSYFLSKKCIDIEVTDLTANEAQVLAFHNMERAKESKLALSSGRVGGIGIRMEPESSR